LSELILGDIIDGSSNTGREDRRELNAPLLQLMLVIEASRTSRYAKDHSGHADSIAHGIISDRRLSSGEFRLCSNVQPEDRIDLIRRGCAVRDGVVYFDLSAHDAEGYSTVHTLLSVSGVALFS